MKVVVTGAQGFIGSHLIPTLSKNGFSVSAILGPREERVGLSSALQSTVTADITVRRDLPIVFSRAEIVIHLAARNHVLKEMANYPLAEYRRVNVDGTRNVAWAAAQSGVKVFLHVSSVKAIGEESEEVLDENSPCAPMTPYGISKLESEAVVREEAARAGMRAVVVRLPMAYGPRNKGNLPRMIRWADRGWPFPLFQPDNLRSMIYVENVVAGILAILRSTSPTGATYILKDKEDCSTRKIYTTICRELGRKPLFVPVPTALVRLGGMLSEDFRKVTGSFRFSSARIEKEIGFVPPFEFEEGIARTVRWYKNSAH